MATAPSITTAQQLWEAGDIGPCELVRGKLIMLSHAGFEDGLIGASIATTLRDFVDRQQLGKVVGAGTGFCIERDPDTVRAPDVAFVKRERIAGRIPAYFVGAPDLAVEVNSSDERRREVQSKAQMWLDCGCSVVWVVDPPTQTVTVIEKDRPPTQLRMGDTLQCPILLPGFALPLAEIFEVED